MRLPVIDKDDSRIDEAAAAEMVDYAMSHGVNYYDTAWGYHSGNSELAMGKALSRYPRESFYLATKFPGYDLSNMDKVEEIFEKQLEKCQVNYFDFYLFHNVCEMNIDAYLDESHGIYQHLMEQKENGRVRHLGFSAHGSAAGRQAGKASGACRGCLKGNAARRKDPCMGLPVPSVGARRNRDSFRNVQFRTDAGKY